nr:immunoglobulin heavy chain junction region [Mus musculus]
CARREIYYVYDPFAYW